jgi:hypothetical protein
MNLEVSTKEEALEKAKELASQGWKVLPIDDPCRATLGYVAFRLVFEGRQVPFDGLHPEGCEEEEVIIEWPLYGSPLVPDDQLVEPSELVDFATSNPSVLLCDDARRLLLGFVRYEPEAGRAVIRRTRLTQFKSSPPETRASISTVRNALMARNDAIRQSRSLEVAIIEQAARNL